jgi:hypothetical protein
MLATAIGSGTKACSSDQKLSTYPGSGLAPALLSNTHFGGAMKSTSSNRLIGILIVLLAVLLATSVAFSQTGSQPGPPPALFGGQAPNVPDVAKNVVVGELKKIEKTNLTVARPDGAEQLVAVDANTKFVGERGDAIKLPDFKPGTRLLQLAP